MPRPTGERLALLFVLVLGIVLLRTAWTCDDAFITFRTLDNFLTGHGLRWNTVERVQVFTHPLWLMVLLVPAAITHEAYLTSMAVSIVVSLSACWLLASRVVPHGLSGVAIVTLLGMSSALCGVGTL